MAAPWGKGRVAPTTSQPPAPIGSTPVRSPPRKDPQSCPVQSVERGWGDPGLVRAPPTHWLPLCAQEGRTHSEVYSASSSLVPSRVVTTTGVVDSIVISGLSSLSGIKAFRYHFPNSCRTFSPSGLGLTPRRSSPVMQPQPLPLPQGQSVSQASPPGQCHHLSARPPPDAGPGSLRTGRDQSQPRSRGIEHRPSRAVWTSPRGKGAAPDPRMSSAASSCTPQPALCLRSLTSELCSLLAGGSRAATRPRPRVRIRAFISRGRCSGPPDGHSLGLGEAVPAPRKPPFIPVGPGSPGNLAQITSQSLPAVNRGQFCTGADKMSQLLTVTEELSSRLASSDHRGRVLSAGGVCGGVGVWVHGGEAFCEGNH